MDTVTDCIPLFEIEKNTFNMPNTATGDNNSADIAAGNVGFSSLHINGFTFLVQYSSRQRTLARFIDFTGWVYSNGQRFFASCPWHPHLRLTMALDTFHTAKQFNASMKRQSSF
ncbi:hypothetical protein ElyMa_004061900 [Elysia marginata]|uniref:Uncharacterized protein n=1 Tax=Elysia marginata TaxID=1093978 RepID=A0AAV4G6A6_9GAST|nr:hypothetical protein ElyMa_004061900 [Elysia marginata]